MVLAVWYLDPQASKLTNLQTYKLRESIFFEMVGADVPLFLRDCIDQAV